MPTTNAIIAVAPHDLSPRKVLRIVGSRDGSFSISVPYYPPLPGLIFKAEAPAIIEPDERGASKPIDPHRVDVPVKMSFHAGGFVQFSSVGNRPVRSGRGRFYVPKGMGIHSQPILSPIETGPTFGCMCNALHRMAEVDGTEKAKVITFDEHEFFERDDHRPGWRHLYSVEGFVFEPSVLREARLVDGTMTLVKEYSPLRPEWPVTFKFFELPTSLATIGIVVSRRHEETTDLRDGYSLSGPRDLGSRRWLAGTWFEDQTPTGSIDPADLPPSLALEPSVE